MRSGEERGYGEATVDNKTEAELRQEYPRGTLISAFIDGKWRMAKIVDNVSIKQKKFVAKVGIFPDKEGRIERADETTGGGVGILQEIHADMAGVDEEAATEVEGAIDETAAAVQEVEEELDAASADVEAAGEEVQEFSGRDIHSIVLNHAPVKAEFSVNLNKDFDKAGKSGIDAEEKAKYIVTDAVAIEDGSIEYSVTGKGTGETHHTIPQELLLLWRDVEQTERKLRVLEQEIHKNIAVSRRADLLHRVAEAHAQVVLAKKQVPDLEAMPSVDRSVIDKIAKELDIIHNKAKESVDGLFSIYTREFSSASSIAGESNAETFAEREARIKQEEESQKPKQDYIAQVEADIRKGAAAEFQAIDDEEAAALSAAMEKAQEKRDAAAKKAKDAKKPEPPAFDEDAFVESYRPDSKFQAKREALERKMILQIFKNNEAHLAALKVTKEDDTTDEQVKMDFRFRTALFDKRSALAKKDKTTPLAEKESPPNDYLVNDDPDSAYAKATYEAYKEVAKEWKKSIQNSEQDSADAEEEKLEFNFDDLINLSWDITDERRGLLSKIPMDSTTKQPEAAFKDIYAKLKLLADEAKDCKYLYARPYKELESFDNFKTKEHKVGDVKYQITNQEELQKFRKAAYTDYLDFYHKLNKRLQGMLISKEYESAAAKAKEAPKSAEKKEKKNGFVNIPEAVLRENLFSKGGRLGQFKEAMRLVYGDVFGKSAGLTPASLEAFKKLLPAKEDEELLKAFAPYGLKDWGEFKTTWDAQMAPKFAEALRISADAKFKCKVAKKITWYKQAWAIKGDLAVRIGTTALLVGGATMLSSIAAGLWLGGTATFWGGATALSGAGVGGGLRGWLNEKVFGSKEAKAKMKAKMDTLQQEVEIGSKDTVIEELLNEQFGGAEAKADYKKATASVDLLPQLTAIMTETIQEITAKESLKKPQEAANLSKEEKELQATLGSMSTDARATYERALLTLEPGDRSDMKLRLKLAVGISKVVGNGDELEKEVLAKMTFESKDGAPMEGLKTFFAGLSGKRGITVAAATGVTVRGAYMLGNAAVPGVGYVAATGTVALGGGGVVGHEIAHKQDMEKNRESARKVLVVALTDFKRRFQEYPQKRPTADSEYVSDMRAELLKFKKMLHGEVPAEFAPALFVDKRYDQFGDLTAARLQLYKQIRVAVLDAEATGILMEGFDKQKERLDANRMGMVLARLSEVKKEVQGDKEEAVAEANIKTMQGALETESKRWTANKIVKTVGAALVMAGVSVGLGLSIKELLRPETEGVQGGQTMQEKVADLQKIGERNLAAAAAAKELADSSSTDVAGDHSGPAPDTTDTASVEPEPHNYTESEPPPNPMVEDGIDKTRWSHEQKAGWIRLQDSLRDLKAREFPTEKPDLIKDHQGPSHTLDRLEAASKHSILGEVDDSKWSNEQKAGWAEMQKDFPAWREEQLHDMGYRWIDGKQVGPLSMRTGDEMKLFWDSKAGEWKARFEGFEYDEHGNPKIELNKDGTPKLDSKGDVIPVDHFKGRVHDHVPTSKGRNLGEQVRDWEESIEAKKQPSANKLLEDLHKADKGITPQYDPYTDPAFEGKASPQDLVKAGPSPKADYVPKIGDGHGPMPDDGLHGDPTKELEMLRTSPELIDNLVDTDDPLGEADELQKFTEQYVKAHAPNPGSSADVNAFRSAMAERAGGGSDVTKEVTEVKIPRVANLFYEDHASPDNSARGGGSSASANDNVEVANTELDSTPANDDAEPSNVIEGNFGARAQATQNGIWESSDKSWKVQFERDGGVIESMKFEGLPPNPELIAHDVLADFDGIYSQITADPDASKLFNELSEFKTAYDDLALQGELLTEQGNFVKMQLVETMDVLQSKFGGVDTDIFKSELLEKLGLSARQKAA